MTPQQLLCGIGVGALILLWVAVEFFSSELLDFLFGKNVLENKQSRRYGLPEKDEHEQKMSRIIDEEIAKHKKSRNDEPFDD